MISKSKHLIKSMIKRLCWERSIKLRTFSTYCDIFSLGGSPWVTLNQLDCFYLTLKTNPRFLQVLKSQSGQKFLLQLGKHLAIPRIINFKVCWHPPGSINWDAIHLSVFIGGHSPNQYKTEIFNIKLAVYCLVGVQCAGYTEGFWRAGLKPCRVSHQ